MLRALYLSIFFSLTVIGFAWLATAASLASFSRFSAAISGEWRLVSGWSGVVDPGWGGFHAVTKTPNVGAIGMLVEPSAYLKPEFVAAWRDAKEVDTGLIAYVWRSKEAGLDYPVYFAGGIPIQKTEISGDDVSVVAEKPGPAWVEAGLLYGILHISDESGAIVARHGSSGSMLAGGQPRMEREAGQMAK